MNARRLCRNDACCIAAPICLRPVMSLFFAQSARRLKVWRGRGVGIRMYDFISLETQLGDIVGDAGINADDSADAPPVTQEHTPLQA